MRNVRFSYALHINAHETISFSIFYFIAFHNSIDEHVSALLTFHHIVF